MTETVNHPAHYQTGGIEVIEIIHRYRLDFALGSAIKYIFRADHKGNRLEDLRKARWCIAWWRDKYLAGDVTEPTADESTLEWNDPDTIADKKGLTGDVREAVIAILEIAVFAYEDVTFSDQLTIALSSLDAEIAAISTCGGAAA